MVTFCSIYLVEGVELRSKAATERGSEGRSRDAELKRVHRFQAKVHFVCDTKYIFTTRTFCC